MTGKADLHKNRIVERIGLKLLLTVGVIVGGLFALSGTVHAEGEAETPRITTQPQNLTLTYGYVTGNVLSIEASVTDTENNEISYQWYEGDNPIYDATASSYTIPVGKGVAYNNTQIHCVVTATRTDNGNTATATSDNALITLNAKTATLLWSKTSLIYNGSAQKPTAIVNNLEAGDKCEVEVEGARTLAGGSYTATAVSLTNPNYTLPVDATCGFLINHLTAILSWTPDPCKIPYTGSPRTPGATVSNLASGDEGKCSVTVEVEGEHTNVGTYTANATGLTGAASSNYSFSPESKQFSIEKVDPHVDAIAGNTLTYTGADQELVTGGTTSDGHLEFGIGTENEEPASYSESVPKATDCGTYYVWYKVIGDENHNNTATQKLTATISPVDKAGLTAAISSATAYYNSIKDSHADIANTLKTAIDAAELIVQNNNVTSDAVTSATTSVNNAKSTAETAIAAEGQEAADVAAANTVISQINALPETVTIADKTAIEAARNAYNALTVAQKAKVDASVLQKLTNAETALTAAEAQEAEDVSAANAVKDLIDALPSPAELSHKGDVDAARSAYNALTAYQKTKIDAATLNKLTDAEASVANAVKALIDALPSSVQLTDKVDIEAARSAYNSLSTNQKGLIDAATLKKLTDAEADLKALEDAAEKEAKDTAAANAVTSKINALPSAGNVKVSDKTAIEAARAAYNGLTADQKAKIDAATLKKLVDAEAALAVAQEAEDTAKADAVKAKIDALPEKAKITLNDKSSINAARTAYDALTSAQKSKIDSATLKRLTDAEDALKALEKPELKIYPIEHSKEYGNDDPELTYWIEEVGTTNERVKSTNLDSSKFKGKIKGKLIREDGQSLGTYKIKPEKDRTDKEKDQFLKSDYYTLTIVNTVLLEIKAKTITSSMVTVTPSSHTYNGDTKYVDVYVKDGSTYLEEDYDYTIDSSSKLSAVGASAQTMTYTVKVTGKGNYTGTASKTWTINKKSSSGGTNPSTTPSTTPTTPASSTSTPKPTSTNPTSSTPSTSPSSGTAPSSKASSASDTVKNESGETEAPQAVDTGVSEDTLRQLADNTKIVDADNTLKSIIGEAALNSLKASGQSPAVKLSVTPLSVISSDEKMITEESINYYSGSIPNLMPGAFLDVSLMLKATGTWQIVSSTANPVTFVIDIPEEFQKKSEEFYVLRIHGRKATLLYDQDNDPKTVTIDSDLFSTYVLMYPGNKAGTNTPTNTTSRVNSLLLLWVIVGVIIIAILIFLLIYFLFDYRRREMKAEKNREEDKIDTRPKW